MYRGWVSTEGDERSQEVRRPALLGSGLLLVAHVRSIAASWLSYAFAVTGGASSSGDRFQLDRTKFRELLIYIAGQHEAEQWLGDTVLNKILFFSDFLSYQRRGEPITGAAYQKLDFGPAPKALLPARNDLVETGELRHTPSAGEMQRTTTVALRAADLSVFTPPELAIVDEVISFCREQTAAELSDFSHEWSAGWNLVESHEVIPYSSALIKIDGPSEVSRAAAIAAIGRRAA